MKVKIISDIVETRTGTKNGRDWQMTSQNAYVQMGEETRRMSILIPKSTSPYAPGEYEVDFEKSCYFNSFGQLVLSGELKLKAVETKQSGSLFSKAS